MNSPLPPRAKKLLSDYRSGEALGDAARERVLAGLRARISAEPPGSASSPDAPGGGVGSAVAPAGTSASSGVFLKLVVVALIAAPVVWLIARRAPEDTESGPEATKVLDTAARTPSTEGAGAVSRLEPELMRRVPARSAAPLRAPESDATLRAPESDATLRAPQSDATLRAPEGDAPFRAPESDAAAPRAERVVTNAPSTSRVAAPRGTAPLPSSSGIDEEVELLNRAHAALEGGNAGTALRLLAEHAARFPRSPLSESREVERILALCRSGQVAGARAAEAFLAARGSSPYAARVRAACPAPAAR